MVTHAIGEECEVPIDPERVPVPPSVAIGFVASGERRSLKSDAFHLALCGPHLQDSPRRRYWIEDLEANVLVTADDRTVRVLPHPMRTGDDNGQHRTAELLGDPEGARVEGCLDAEDAPLGEDDEALTSIERRFCATQQGSEAIRSGTCGDAGLL